MSQIVVNNTNIIVESYPMKSESRADRQRRLRTLHSDESPARRSQELLRRQIDEARSRIGRVACTSTWAEDCLYRGASYAPDFRCQCATCRGEFPERLHPRQAMESRYSLDCQVETEVDPELAEEVAGLRNDRLRAGSVIVDFRRGDRLD
jgi:hypothetical protein